MISHHLQQGHWRDMLAQVDRVDALIVDAPYSAKTHGGHDSGALSFSKGRRSEKKCARRELGYGAWNAIDVANFVAAWSSRATGWFVTITDHALVPVWADAMRDHGRYVFAPLPWVAPGSRIRLAGDGPSSWTCWIVVGRPREGAHCNGVRWCNWGTLPGAYITTGNDRNGAAEPVVGAKPLALMHDLIRDYTEPGDVVCDPCAGGGTTLCAALDRGRMAIGAEIDPGTHAHALERIERHRIRAERLTTHELRRHDRPDRAQQLQDRRAARDAPTHEQAALPLGAE